MQGGRRREEGESGGKYVKRTKYCEDVQREVKRALQKKNYAFNLLLMEDD